MMDALHTFSVKTTVKVKAMTPETCLTILGIVSELTGLHSWFTGLKTGNEMKKLQRELERTQADIQRLSHHILYVPSVQQVRDITQTRQERLDDSRTIRELLEPVQRGLDDDVLATSILATPQKLQKAFRRNPWDVLIEITPVNRARVPNNPSLVPILFADGATQYIGWQTQGVLPSLFDCEYDPGKGPNIPRQWTNSIGMEFVLIPAGKFMMGSPGSKAVVEWEQPAHRVTISQPFYLGKYPVTQAQWEAVMGNNPSQFRGGPHHPVETVSWDDGQAFLDKLNEMEGGGDYRLPTEAEWEYACRAGTETPRYHPDVNAIAWYGENSNGHPQPVGQKLSNAWGLYDMLGNVWEWCHDGARTYTVAEVVDPIGPTRDDTSRFFRFTNHVFRGCHWGDLTINVRAANRSWISPGFRDDHLGFRCASLLRRR
jgi:formylglycine-generating enzyme required for sulfatase activity